jgi:hypothetical protein
MTTPTEIEREAERRYPGIMLTGERNAFKAGAEFALASGAVAGAVLAEREACAKIAENIQTHAQGMLSGTRLGAVHEGACLEIARAIRSRSAPKADG